MSHEFSNKPIKVHYVDISTGIVKTTYVFIGRVDKEIEKELNKVVKLHNSGKKIPSNSQLKRFYGNKWQSILGLEKVGGHENSLDDLVNSYTWDMDQGVTGGNQISSNEMSSGKEKLVFDISGLDILNTEYEIAKDESPNITSNISPKSTPRNISEPNSPTNKSVTIIDKTQPKTDMLITEQDIESPREQPDNNVFLEKQTIADIKTNGNIELVFVPDAFPSDTIFDFKMKLYTTIGIPIYRQHLWFRFHEATIPCSYKITIAKHTLDINIENLIEYNTTKNNNLEDEKTSNAKKTSNDNKKIGNDNKKISNDGKKTSNNNKKISKKHKAQDEILGLPVDMNNYRNKDYMVIKANDMFNLLYTNWETYNVTEYYIADLQDLVSPKDLGAISKDKYQLDILYWGLIVKYFPIMTYDVFQLYVKNEDNISAIYPDLQPDKRSINHRFELETDITYEAYEAEDNKKLDNMLSSSITGTIVNINNFQQSVEILLDFRNLFDLVELTPLITYCKTNLIYENRNIILRKSYFGEKEPTDIMHIDTLLIKIKSSADTNENIRVIFFRNGNYTIHTEWREEMHMDFKKITKQVAVMVNPLIKLINKNSSKVKFYDIEIPLVEESNVVFTNTSLVFYIIHDVTEARFNVFKKILIDFARAGIIIPKESITTNIEYYFTKGMYVTDSSRIEKQLSVANYYEYLTNVVVKQKWETSFVKVHTLEIANISSRIKISINGIKNDIEMMFFHMYLGAMLQIYLRNAEHIKYETGHSHIRMIKNLKLQDPLLYDFKKIYKSNIVYSKICQKPYQPQILSDEEYKNMPEDRKAKAIKYWNFTKQQPVWYSCPNPKFPYVKFIIKQHPKDFCIPCCKKMGLKETINQTRKDIYNSCLKNHIFTEEKVSTTKSSRYIATYGKDIEVGRISRLPENTLEPLFFNTYSTEHGIDQECITSDGYYLFGLDQNTKAISSIGMLFCLVHSLQTDVSKFLLDMVKRIKAKPDQFHILLQGTINLYFSSYEDLCSDIMLIQSDTVLNVPSGLDWNKLLISIAYYYFGVNVVLFDDQNREKIELQLPFGLKNADEMFPNSHKNLVVMRKKNKYYPVYLLNTELFKKVGIIETKLFSNNSGLIEIIKAVVKHYFSDQNTNNIKPMIDLPIIKEFAKFVKLNIDAYYINYNNLCYAVLIDGCYWPIEASYYSPDAKLIFEPNNTLTKYEKFLVLINKYNKFVDHISKQNNLTIDMYPKVILTEWLQHKNNIVGFMSGSNSVSVMYPTTVSIEYAKKSNKPISHIKYDMSKINEMIFDYKAGKKNVVSIGIKNNLTNKLHKDLYNYYLYQLVLLQFIGYFNKQQNRTMRRAIMNTLVRTNFDKNTEQIKQIVDELPNVDDQNKIKNIVARFLTTHRDKKQLLYDINEARFSFDNLLFEELKTMPHDDVVKKLKKISTKFIKIGSLPHNFKFPNTLVVCDQTQRSDNMQYCHGSKLIVSNSQFNDIIDILANDIRNPLKWKWLFNVVFIEKSIFYFRFTRRAAEHISIEFL